METFTPEEQAFLKTHGIIITPVFRVSLRWESSLSGAIYHMIKEYEKTKNPVFEKAIMHIRWTEACNTCLLYMGMPWQFCPVKREPIYSSMYFKNKEEWINEVQKLAEEGNLLAKKVLLERAKHRFKQPKKRPSNNGAFIWPQ